MSILFTHSTHGQVSGPESKHLSKTSLKGLSTNVCHFSDGNNDPMRFRTSEIQKSCRKGPCSRAEVLGLRKTIP